ncbi:hypothetical protein L5849_04780 [Erythrobacter sp. SN021]|uniref:hypothetical protein n=1 Tax=Erythrobacter sp. SN021 TaxID=2912574 RepID=UPI001F3CF453|nr:hypothetical protein [Erythrobacter sp. SN021]MCF8882013.1 hypothetical protein [Erythrobacter sp. SN021]
MTRKPFDIIAHDLRFVISPIFQVEAGSVQLSDEFRTTWTVGDLNRHHVALGDRSELTGRYEDLIERVEDKPASYFGEFDVHQSGPLGGGWSLTFNLGREGFEALLRGLEVRGLDESFLCIDVTRSSLVNLTASCDAALLQFPARVEVRSQDQL